MSFFRFSGHFRNWLSLLQLLPCRTHLSIGASFPPLIYLLFCPRPPTVVANPVLPFTFISLSWTQFPSCPFVRKG